MTEPRTCDQCGSPTTGGVPEGMCPSCLLGVGLGDNDDEGEPAADPAPIAEHPGDMLGHYLLHEQIGEGGFGIVFRAEQMAPVRRMVALKIIKPGMDSKEVIARFEAERQALALMSHPYIAKVYDAGTTEHGRPYFVMELVEGKPLSVYCDERRLKIDQRLAVFAEICDAVQHAHQKGVIHRDLKPSNILVCDTDDDKPLPKIIDFGVAKAISIELTERTFFTVFGRLVGTPHYMSPEQATMNAVDVDTRSDIYSLGVALYQLITGKTPLEQVELTAIDFDEMRRLIREKEPLIPSARIAGLSPSQQREIGHARNEEPAKIRRHIGGDLDWITMKALDKDPDRRYATAQSFALDLRRFLDGLPVLAGPPGAAYRVGKFIRRHRGAVAVTAVALVTLLGVSIGALRVSSDLRKAFKIAEFEGNNAKVEHLQMLLERVQNSKDGESGSKRRGLRDLEEIGEGTQRGISAQWIAETDSKTTIEQLRNDARDQLIDSLAWTDLTEQTLLHHLKAIGGAAFDAEHQRFVVGFKGGGIEVHDVTSGIQGGARRDFGSSLAGPLEFSTDGGMVAVGKGDPKGWELLIWNWRDDVLRDFEGEVSGVNQAFDFEPGSGGFAVGTAERTLEIVSGDGVLRYPPLALGGVAETIRFSPDGRWIAVATGSVGRGPRLMVIDVAEQKTVTTLEGIHAVSLAWEPNQRALLAGRIDGGIVIFEPHSSESFTLVSDVTGHTDRVVQVAWSHDGKLAASGGQDGTIQLWNILQRRPIRSYVAWAERLSFSKTDNSIGPVASISERGSLSKLEIDPPSACSYAAGHPGEEIIAAAWNPDGTVLATAAKGGVKLWNRKGTELKWNVFSNLAVRPGGLAFSSTHLYTSENGSVSRREVRVDGEHVRVGLGTELLGGFGEAGQIVLTADGESLVMALDGGVKLMHLGSRRITEFADPPPATASLAVSPDGKWLAAGSESAADARVWSMDAPEKSYRLKVASPPAVAFYPLWKSPLTGGVIPPHLMIGDEEAYRVWTVDGTQWSTDEQKKIPSDMETRGRQRARMVFSSRGSSLAISFERRVIKVLRPNGRDLTDWVLMTKPSFDDQFPLAISPPGGRLLVTADAGGRLHLWDYQVVADEVKKHSVDWPNGVPRFVEEPALVRPY